MPYGFEQIQYQDDDYQPSDQYRPRREFRDESRPRRGYQDEYRQRREYVYQPREGDHPSRGGQFMCNTSRCVDMRTGEIWFGNCDWNRCRPSRPTGRYEGGGYDD
jgi:hypothetical protein